MSLYSSILNLYVPNHKFKVGTPFIQDRKVVGSVTEVQKNGRITVYIDGNKDNYKSILDSLHDEKQSPKK